MGALVKLLNIQQHDFIVGKYISSGIYVHYFYAILKVQDAYAEIENEITCKTENFNPKKIVSLPYIIKEIAR